MFVSFDLRVISLIFGVDKYSFFFFSAAEALDRRSGRLEPDLVRDEVEEELIKELALCAEIRDLFNRTLGDLSHMIVEQKAAKQRLESDWSDKKAAFETEALAVGLNNRSTVIMFKPGSTRYADK